jgi:hypothetical protein
MYRPAACLTVLALLAVTVPSPARADGDVVDGVNWVLEHTHLKKKHQAPEPPLAPPPADDQEPPFMPPPVQLVQIVQPVQIIQQPVVVQPGQIMQPGIMQPGQILQPGQIMQGQIPQQLNLQSLNANCATDPRVRAMNELRSNQTAFISVLPDRVNQILKRAAAVVKNRYLEIAQPAHGLGRLVRPPFCGGAGGGGVLVQGNTIGTTVRLNDTSQFPDFQTCLFVYESEVQPENSPLQLNHVTELSADIHMDLGFDETAMNRRASHFRQTGTPAAKFDVQLMSEPFVMKAQPNYPPPVSFAQKPVFPAIVPTAELEDLGDLKDMGVDDTPQNRLILARRAIKAKETSFVFTPSILEEVAHPNDAFDPCGEAQPLSPFLIPLARVMEEHCYTYTSSLTPNGDERGEVLERQDPRYRGQARILFQKDIRTGKILGIRAYSFGGDI